MHTCFAFCCSTANLAYFSASPPFPAIMSFKPPKRPIAPPPTKRHSLWSDVSLYPNPNHDFTVPITISCPPSGQLSGQTSFSKFVGLGVYFSPTECSVVGNLRAISVSWCFTNTNSRWQSPDEVAGISFVIQAIGYRNAANWLHVSLGVELMKHAFIITERRDSHPVSTKRCLMQVNELVTSPTTTRPTFFCGVAL